MEVYIVTLGNPGGRSVHVHVLSSKITQAIEDALDAPYNLETGLEGSSFRERGFAFESVEGGSFGPHPAYPKILHTEWSGEVAE